MAGNDQLRAARERTASPTYATECLSRQELAELVNAYIWEQHHKMVALDHGYLGKLERGIIRWPGTLYREALRAILGVPTDAALGFVNARRALVKLDDVDRKKFLVTTALGVGAAALAPVAALLEGGEPTPTPVRVGATEIAQIRDAAQAFESWCV
ncbi:MAG TPA: XRE family transcriptional regulator, partial [Pseudonocardiaceae bacterium]|nr:XRE family transcriptional regulator [Pseudonocardiaceae bacterium]